MTRIDGLSYTPPPRHEIDICLHCTLADCDEADPRCRLMQKATNGEIELPQGVTKVFRRKRITPTDYGRKLMIQKRTERGLSPQQIADIAGVSREVIYNIEHGRSGIKETSAVKVVAALGVSMDELFKED